ncbi:MAG: hypothetical protein MHMPM18_002562, partial [Marteilia pararefringens]
MYEFETLNNKYLEKIIDFAKTNFKERPNFLEENRFNIYRDDFKYYSEFDPRESDKLQNQYITKQSNKPETLLVLEILSDSPFHLNAKIPIELDIDKQSVKLITDHRSKTILVKHWNNLLYICEIRSLGISDWGSSMIVILEPQTIIPNNLLISVPDYTENSRMFGVKIREFRDFDYIKVRDEMQKSDYFSRVSPLLPFYGISRSDFNAKMQVNQSFMKKKVLQCIQKYLPLLPCSYYLDKMSLQYLVTQIKLALFCKKDSINNSINSPNIQNIIQNIEELEDEYFRCKCGEKLVQCSNLISLDKYKLECYGYDFSISSFRCPPLVSFRYHRRDKKHYGFTEDKSEGVYTLECNNCKCIVGYLRK